MTKSLEQKSLSKITIYEIDDTGLLVKTSSKTKISEIHFPFEQIKTNKASVLEHNKGVMILSAIFLGLSILVYIISFIDKEVEKVSALFWLILSLVFGIIYFFSRTRKTYLQTTDNNLIIFIANKKSAQLVSDFIDTLLSVRNEFLLKRYATFNKNLEYAVQFDNLNWLLNAKAISKGIYDQKLDELNKLFNFSSTSPQIGFVSSN